MPLTVEEIQERIEHASASGFRFRLIARGQARAMVWRDGILPDGAPEFSPHLSYDLLSYGYALFSQGLRLRDMGGSDVAARMAFEQAAAALESVISQGGALEEHREFHFVLTGAAYQLAHLSARAYSLLSKLHSTENLSSFEKVLTLLMLRNFDELERFVLSECVLAKGSDSAILNYFEKEFSELPEDDLVPENTLILEGLSRALHDNFMSSVALFLYAFEHGDVHYIEQAIEGLKEGLSVCSEVNLLPQWWMHRVAIHIVKELWNSSFHKCLPKEPMGGSATNWQDLRERFIATLYKRKKAEIDLWPSQIDAATRAVDQEDNLVVSLPTSAGKTRVAELCILRCLAANKRVIFVTPLRALSAQTEVSLLRTFAPLGIKISTLYGSIGVNGLDVDALRSSNIVVATPEKLDFAIRNDTSLLNDVGLLIFDEGHMIGLNEREVRYEAQIQRLLRREDADSRRIVCLSAILPEGDQLDDFSNWLRRDRDGGVIKSEWRPTRLRFGEVTWGNGSARLNLRVGDERPFVPNFITAFLPSVGRRRKLFPSDQGELCLATAWKLVTDGQSVLLFCPLRASVEPFAERIVDLNSRGALPSLLTADPTTLQSAIALGEEWLGPNSDIIKCLKLGVAIHHGALPTAYRKEIERLLRDGVLKVTISSPTLAQGLNLTATSVVFSSLFRNRELIPTSEFKNIIGRAGRAFIDVEGLVLYPIFDDHTQRLNNWEKIIADLASRELESGLVRLLVTLLVRMQAKVGAELGPLTEYVVNNAQAWEFPKIESEDAKTESIEKVNWENFLASLDTAILSLLGDVEIADENIETALDSILQSSLWQRRLLRRTQEVQNVIRTALIARAKYVWNASNPTKRKGYFLAGLGLKAGAALDEIAPQANAYLVEANNAIIVGENDRAINAITEFAQLLFTISPFALKNIPDNWPEILRLWLIGSPLAALAENDEANILKFIEEGLVYRLPWAMESVRVRGIAHGDVVGEFPLSAYELSAAVAAVEAGTLNRPTCTLIRAGFNSRMAAIKIVSDTQAKFLTASELQNWLNSETVRTAELNHNWPTAETRGLWDSFRNSYNQEEVSEWKERLYTAPVTWEEGISPIPGTGIRIYDLEEIDHQLLLSPKGDVLGRMHVTMNAKRKGLLKAKVGEINSSISLTYIGPEDFVRIQ